jgi:hypothetical protein
LALIDKSIEQLDCFPYSFAQTQVRNQQAQDTSIGITRGARTLKGRLPTVADGCDPVKEWKLGADSLKQAITKGTFKPFHTALEKGLIANGSSMDHFVTEASTMLRRRRLFKADGSSVGDASAGDATSSGFLALMRPVVRHMIAELDREYN